MSDPFDARILRSLVREAAAAEGKTPDWDSLEDKLFARLDEAPTALSRAMAREEDDDQDEDANTAVRLSELPGEERVSPEPALPMVGVVASHHGAVVHMPGAVKVTVVDGVGGNDADADESAASESFHSPSLILEPDGGRVRGSLASPVARRFFGVVGALAVAACIALMIGSVIRRSETGPGSTSNSVSIQEERWVDASQLPLAQGLENVRDAGSLQRGDVVEATQGAVAFGLKDQLMWTLTPGSRVRIEASTDAPGGNHVVTLQSGSLRASVAGGARVNPLVVQAGDAMVSVDGTSLPALFTVTRSSKGLAVEMEQGTALVSALTGGDAHRLGALQRGFMSLDAKVFKLLEPVAITEPVRTSVTADGLVPTSTHGEPNEVRHPEAPPVVASSRVDRPAPLPDPPAASSAPATTVAANPPAVPEVSEASVRTSVSSCIDGVMRKQASQGGVSVSAESTVRFVVDEEGVIRSASFNPPLKPELQACAAPLLRSKVSGGVRSIQFPVSVAAR